MTHHSPDQPDLPHVDPVVSPSDGLAQTTTHRPTPSPVLHFARLRPAMLGRDLPNGRRCGERDRVTHLFTVPIDASAPALISALCRLQFAPGSLERLTGFRGTPCELCLSRTSEHDVPPGPGVQGADALTTLESPSASVNTDHAASELPPDGSPAGAWTPSPLRLDRASTARLDNFYADGENYYSLEREFAGHLPPHFRAITTERQAFRRRALTYARSLGVTQILDIGCGIPVAESTDADVAGDESMRAVYADCEAQAIATMEVRVGGTEQAAVVLGDFLRPETILEACGTAMMLDFGRPMCLVLTGLLEHCPPGHDLPSVLRRYVDRMAPGSLVIASHLTLDGLDPCDPADADSLADMTKLQRSFEKKALHTVFFRDRNAFTDIVSSLEMVPPGVVWTHSWRPADEQSLRDAELPVCFAAVGLIR